MVLLVIQPWQCDAQSSKSPTTKEELKIPLQMTVPARAEEASKPRAATLERTFMVNNQGSAVAYTVDLGLGFILVAQ